MKYAIECNWPGGPPPPPPDDESNGDKRMGCN